jgi:tetratricopeptide (TPR) repeat protein
MFDDLYILRDRARSAAARGDLDGATNALLEAAAHTHVAETDYLAILRPLSEALSKQGDARRALTVLSYIASIDASAWKHAEARLPNVPPIDRAPLLAAQGRLSEAAGEVEKAGLMAAAAIYRERASDWRAARTLWSRLGHVTESGEDVYVAALVRFNLARCARQCGDSDQARKAIAASVRLLEEAADHFESIGQRERAFDCFQVLVQVGRESGAFEDVLEGFVNSIRILREDHLEYDFALELFDAAIAAATERGESRAAATLARQAAEYARGLGLAALASEYALKQAMLWRAVAQQQQSRQASPEVAENALRSAVVAFGEIGQFARVGESYAQLSQLELDPSRREHYARAAKRYEGVTDEPLPTSGAHRARPRRELHQPDVWHVDVLEWERKGNAAEACLDVLMDRRLMDDKRNEGGYIRRKALLARLTALRLEAALDREPERPAAPEAWLVSMRVRLAEQLGEVQLYAALSPLEALFDQGERRVKVAVLRALERMCFKRSFITVRAALRDADPAVAQQASETVSALCFPPAVDPLSRIMAESAQPTVRAAALRALSRIDTLEAAELVLGVLEHGTPADREAALAAVKDTHGTKLMELARAALPRSTGTLHATLVDLLS